MLSQRKVSRSHDRFVRERKLWQEGSVQREAREVNVANAPIQISLRAGSAFSARVKSDRLLSLFLSFTHTLSLQPPLLHLDLPSKISPCHHYYWHSSPRTRLKVYHHENHYGRSHCRCRLYMLCYCVAVYMWGRATAGTRSGPHTSVPTSEVEEVYLDFDQDID